MPLYSALLYFFCGSINRVFPSNADYEPSSLTPLSKILA